ncbi:putative uridylyltransferase [Anatilimnocola aggregata]|uniref:Putative uridylyltransferase n=1 Tax=Anatilimnocola aggregata TaxID=2528021 RepID=A0A517YNL7_9BACT|nr:UTP--glucose-1-phosphate uridylyltransferase [Anatilimnocola aggregata]QDU31822.1 putative uridylyltransferase [Anatilimnocola aggregata]
MTSDAKRDLLLDKLRPAGQEHLLQFWSQLPPSEQAKLAEQIAALDLATFTQLKKKYGGVSAAEREKTDDPRAHWAALAARATSPPAMRLDGSGVPFTKEAAIERGQQLLRDGQVGMILVAGGLGTRLGFDEPKGMFPIGPLSQRPMFQVLIEQLLAVRERYEAKIPLYVMTSPATDRKTREFLAAHDNFGLPADDLHYFCQATMWAVDDQWQRILLASPSELVLAPDGHGGMLKAFEKSGALADCQQRGLSVLFYGQIDNPLLQVCDPLLLGSHRLAGSEMTTQVVKKRHALERVGNLVAADNRVLMIEYSDLPDEFAKQTLPDGSLKFWAGNLAVHVLDVAFLQRSAVADDALPFHVAHKKTPHIDESGKRIEPDKPNAYRFERFIFDLLNSANNALVVEADPADAFAPVKNADREPTDNAPLARQAMMALHRRWLRAAGVQIADDVPVEINPLFAASPAEIAAKLPPGTSIEQPTYFSPAGPTVVREPSR